MPGVKAEEIEIRALPHSNVNRSPFSTSLGSSDDRRPRQYAIDRSARIHSNASPYSTDGRYYGNIPVMYRQEPPAHPAVLAQAIGQASHDSLMGTGNAAYRYVWQELTEMRAAVATYHRQNAELKAQLKANRDAYMQIYLQQKEHACGECRIEPNLNSLRDIEAPGLNTCPPAASMVHGRERGPSPSDAPQVPIPAVPPQISLNPQVSVMPPDGAYGPVTQLEGFQLINYIGPWSTTPADRPSDLPVQVFWKKSDWFGKGYPNGSFVTDRNGKHLKHLIKGIRGIARRIWSELERRPGSYVATTFKRNEHVFKCDFVATIEEIYPCLKLCCGHWKALQIGVAAYSYWYKRRGKRDALQRSTTR